MSTGVTRGVCCAIAALVLCTHINSIASAKKVRKEVQMEYMVDSLGRLVPDSTVTTKLYDRNGNVTEETNKSIWLQLKRVVVYLKKNFYSHRSRYDSSETFVDGKQNMTLRVKHDSLGRESEVEEFSLEYGRGYRNRTSYLAGSKLKSKVETYDRSGKLFNFRNYRYDAKSNLTEESGSEQGEPRYRWRYRYDANNRLAERDDYSGTGQLVRRNIYTYGTDGRISQMSIVNALGQLERVVKYSYEYF